LLAPYRARDVSVYTELLRLRQRFQAEFDDMSAGYDAVLLPAATGAAPPLSGTGDAVMNRFWTALHVPAITVPLWRNAENLPLGLQLVGRLGSDRDLLRVAEWLSNQR